MGAKGVVSFVAIVVLLFPLAATVVLETHRDAQLLPLDNLSNPEEMMDEEMAELIWANCGAEFTRFVEVLQDSQSSGTDKELSVQDHQVKKTIQDCLRDKNINFPVSIENKHIRMLYIKPGETPIRRRLAEANTPAPSQSPSPSSSARCDTSQETPCFPSISKELDRSNLERDIEPIPFTVSKASEGITQTTIIIAVVSTATVTLLLATLLFCWYTRTYGVAQNDEKPLLSLSMSDYSKKGASQKVPFSKQNSVIDSGNGADQPKKGNTEVKKMGSSVHSSVSLGIPVEPPPVPGIPPLKPPPGRPELGLKLPPGRVVSAKPPPVVTAPPPPPPGANAAALRAPAPEPAHPSPPGPPPTAAAPPPAPPRAAPPPPPKPAVKDGPRPPPPPGGGAPRPPGGGMGLRPPRPSSADQADSNKTKLKPFFWDKVMANPDQAMVWHQIKAGSFQFNEEMIENLFGYNAVEKNKGQKKSSSQDPAHQFIQIIDGKKAQNLSILLKALSVTTEEVCDALKEGNELPVELIQTLLKMAPTGEEELKLRLYDGDLSRLGTAERFLKVLVEIPFAFKRLECLLFMCTLEEEEDIIKESFMTLEAACIQLRKSRLFLKLLEAVLKTGNRMNDGTFRGSAQAFKLDTLLKLSDVKGVDGKTTLLHFVVLEIIRAEGVRAAKTAKENNNFSILKTDDILPEASSSQDTDEYYRTLGLHVVSSLSNELDDVKKAAILDVDGLTNSVSKFGHALIRAREFLNTDMKTIDEEDEEDEFQVILSNFCQDAEKKVMWLLEEEKRIMTLVRNTADYFHGQAGKDEGLRLFIIVRDFLIILEKVCKEVKNNPIIAPKKDGSPAKKTQEKDGSSPKMRQMKDGSSPKTVQAKDGSSDKATQGKDVSSDKSTEAKDVSSPRTTQKEDVSLAGSQKTDDSRPEAPKSDHLGPDTHVTDDLRPKTQKGSDLGPETWETDDLRSKAQESDDLAHASWESDDSGPESHETGVLQLVRQETDDWGPETHEVDDWEPEVHENEIRHEAHETDDLQREIMESEDVQHEMLETDEHQHESWESKDLQHGTQENDDWRHESQEADDSRHDSWEADDWQHESLETDGLRYETQETDDWGHETEEAGDSLFETREGNDSLTETHDDDDDDLQHGILDDDETHQDDDLRHETHETDDSLFDTHEAEDSRPMPQEDDDSRQEEDDDSRQEEDDPHPMTHEVHDDSQHDDWQPMTENNDTQSTSRSPSEPSQSSFRVAHEQLLPAIAMRRMDTFSSNSASDED